MTHSFIPALHVLRELYEKPRDVARFQWYIEQMLGETANDDRDVVVPITAANPMGREHCLAAINALIDAEGVARRALDEIPFNVNEPALRVYVALLDDRMGGWTDRTRTEFRGRYGDDVAIRANNKRRFAGINCWTSETYSSDAIAWMTRDAVFRASHLLTRGPARSLRDMLRFDRACALFAGGHDAPTLTPDDLAYTRDVLRPLRDATDQPTCLAALFGDDAARASGYPPLGLSPRAGQALAVSDLEI
jgi:hypothetical protein